MARGPSVARHERAGRLESFRVGVRYASGLPVQRSEDGTLVAESVAEGALSPGRQQLGPLAVGVSLDAQGESARVTLTVRNLGATPLHLESVFVGVRWTGIEGPVGYLRHGWQSWSDTGGRTLGAEGPPDFPSGPWLRGFHHGLPAPPADRRGWHESDLVTVLRDAQGRCCVAGILERGQSTGVVQLKHESTSARVELEWWLERPLDPDEEIELEAGHFALGEDEHALLEDYAWQLGQECGARTGSRFQAGWCSWYQFFHDVSEESFLRNLDALASQRSDFPIDVVQLDDGYQHEIGDWLETNPKFPRGLEPIAAAVRSAGFRPGIWTAPFCVVPESHLFADHPEWLLREGDAHARGLMHPEWTPSRFVHTLDTSQPEVREHLSGVFRRLREIGFSYLKLDFLYTVAMRADAADPRMTRAGRLRVGLAAIREGAGDDAFLLGCGCPQGPAVGWVDGMRIGPDVAPYWEPREPRVPGLEPTVASLRNAVRNVLARGFMHRRLWVNDPDCLMVRHADTELSPAEIRSLSASIAATGGMVVFSDDAPALSDQDRALFRQTLELARDVDAGGGRGTARPLGLTSVDVPVGAVGIGQGQALWMRWNPTEVAEHVDDGAPPRLEQRGVLPPEPLLGTRDPMPRDDGRLIVSLDPHESLLLRVPIATRVGVFCDYDGTFAVQDVGATIAKTHAGERRPELWKRLAAGELTPWTYNMELLDGLELPEATLDAFLETIEASPGAAELIDWCAERRIPFRVLSDGFDRNLDRLMELHGVRFTYDANHLWYEDGRWRLAPGSPDPSCSCGTGVCKAARIRDFRAVHPDAVVVHVGNGRVSDLCASRAADHVFAKDTLADELRLQGVAYEPFEDLRDVRMGLERLVASLEAR